MALQITCQLSDKIAATALVDIDPNNGNTVSSQPYIIGFAYCQLVLFSSPSNSFTLVSSLGLLLSISLSLLYQIDST